MILPIGVEDALCLLNRFVVTQTNLNLTALVVIVRDNILLDELLDLVTMALQVATDVVVVQLGLQRIKLILGIVIVALELRHLHQFLKLFLADLVIGEACLDDTLRKAA